MSSVAGGFVYMLGFSDGVVKIGSTRNVKRRFATLKSEAKTKRAATVVWAWAMPHWQRSIGESYLIGQARSAGAKSFRGREYLTNVDVLTVADRISRLWPEGSESLRGQYRTNRSDVDTLLTPASPSAPSSATPADGGATSVSGDAA